MFPLHGSDILIFESVSEIEECDYSNEPLSSTFLWCCLLCCTKRRWAGKSKHSKKRNTKMNNLKSYRLSGARKFSRRVYSLRSKRQFRAVFKN